MRKIPAALIVSSLLVVGFACVARASTEATKAPGKTEIQTAKPAEPAPLKMKGEITAVDTQLGTVTLKDEKGIEAVFKGTPLKLKKATVGEKVTMLYREVKPGERNVVSILKETPAKTETPGKRKGSGKKGTSGKK